MPTAAWGGGNPFNGFEFNFGAGGFSDIFADVFSEFMGGGSRGARQSSARHGSDVRYNLEISLEEAFAGVEKEIKIPSTEVCEDCHVMGQRTAKKLLSVICATAAAKSVVNKAAFSLWKPLSPMRRRRAHR